jgi:hypothetical protein
MPDQIASSPFTDTGFNSVEVGSELFKAISVTSFQLTDPVQFAKLRGIAEFLNNNPDPILAIGKLSRNVKIGMNALDHFYSYVQLSNDKAVAQKKLDDLTKQLEYYG